MKSDLLANGFSASVFTFISCGKATRKVKIFFLLLITRRFICVAVCSKPSKRKFKKAKTYLVRDMKVCIKKVKLQVWRAVLSTFWCTVPAGLASSSWSRTDGGALGTGMLLLASLSLVLVDEKGRIQLRHDAPPLRPTGSNPLTVAPRNLHKSTDQAQVSDRHQ